MRPPAAVIDNSPVLPVSDSFFFPPASAQHQTAFSSGPLPLATPGAKKPGTAFGGWHSSATTFGTSLAHPSILGDVPCQLSYLIGFAASKIPVTRLSNPQTPRDRLLAPVSEEGRDRGTGDSKHIARLIGSPFDSVLVSGPGGHQTTRRKLTQDPSTLKTGSSHSLRQLLHIPLRPRQRLSPAAHRLSS
jgi:hypothetical protein